MLRKVRGKKNGVIPSFAFDDLRLFKLESDKRREMKRETYLG